MNKPIYVTMPSLAPLSEYSEILKGVWDRGILTHNGPLVQQFEKDLARKLQINNLVAVSNGTIAIQMAIKALELKGEIITTPFTWIATISAIKWEACVPVVLLGGEQQGSDGRGQQPLKKPRTIPVAFKAQDQGE